jgi:hypothetical protein
MKKLKVFDRRHSNEYNKLPRYKDNGNIVKKTMKVGDAKTRTTLQRATTTANN